MKFKIGDKVEVVKVGDDLRKAKIRKGYRGVVEDMLDPDQIGIRFTNKAVFGHTLGTMQAPKNGWYVSSQLLKKVVSRKKKKIVRRKAK